MIDFKKILNQIKTKFNFYFYEAKKYINKLGTDELIAYAAIILGLILIIISIILFL